MNMESIANFLRENKVRARIKNGELTLQAPNGAINAEMAALLKTRKPDIIAAIEAGILQLEAIPEAKGRDGAARITPMMLPLVQLDQHQIDRIASTVPDGALNIQDIYPLAALQEGILFHHLLMPDDDPYLMRSVLAFDSLMRLDQFLHAVQAVIDRHDILRTAIHWEGLPEPVQVVQRRAQLPRIELSLDSADSMSDLLNRSDPRHLRLDLRRAPLLAAYTGQDHASGEWLLALVHHHLVVDQVSLALVLEEVQMLLQGRAKELPPPLPFRDFIARTRSVPREKHEAYFRSELADIDEPTAPFGVMDVHSTERHLDEATCQLSTELAERIRDCARKLGMSPAVLFHVAWAQVLCCCTGRSDVVFGTVLSGRLQEIDGASRMLGLFINTLPLRLSVNNSARKTVEDSYRRMSELLAHEQASLALAQRCSGVAAPVPLFTSVLNYRHSAASPAHLQAEAQQAYAGVRSIAGEGRTNYPITVSVDDFGQGFMLSSQCLADISADRVNGYLNTALKGLTSALANDYEQRLDKVDVLPAAERRKLLADFNATARDYPRDALIHELFEGHAVRTPEATAVVCDGHSLSYGELNARANRLAHHLLSMGVQPDDRVAICMERSIDLIIGQLAILKAGAGYVPLDPTYPTERLAYLLQDAGPVALLTHSSVEGMPPDSVPLIAVDSPALQSQLAAQPEANPSLRSRGLTASNLAYVIYTSGSTGMPKGVMVEHRSVNRLVINNPYCLVEPDDCLANCANQAFDATTWEVWGALLNGARVLVVSRESVMDPAQFKHALIDGGVTAMWLTVGLFNAYVDELRPAFAQLRHLLVGGDTLDPRSIGRLLTSPQRPRRLLNGYGPTEATTFACVYEIQAVARGARSIPIGGPIGNTRAYVLDASMQPVPIGVPGELHIGGDGVARGYLNRPELTAERFLTDPFCDDPTARIYKTGDLVRWLPDGTLEFLGRSDFQVKVRGFRIELGEIEAHLLACEGVKDAVVLARDDTPGDKRLTAYVVPKDGHELAIAALRDALEARLPDYMLPSAFVTLAALPLTSNGKLDRKALPPPSYSAQSDDTYHSPEGEIESALSEVWKKVLQVEQVGRYDSFYSLGGDSIVAMQIVSAASHRGIRITVRDVLESKCIAELAGRQRAASAGADLQRESHGEFRPLPIHREHLDGDLDRLHHYNMSVLLAVDEDFDRNEMQAIVKALYQRHDAFRIRFERASQGLTAWHEPLTEELVSLSCSVEIQSNPEESFSSFLFQKADEYQRSLHLTRGPVFRAVLFEGKKNERRLFLLAHHAVVDMVSWRIIMADMELAHRQFLTRSAITLPPKTTSYQNWGLILEEYAKSESLAEERAFWGKQHLQEYIFPIEFDSEPLGATMDWVNIEVSVEATQALLKKTPLYFNSQTKELLLSAIYIGAKRWSRQSGIMFQMESHGRESAISEADLTQTVGWFTATYPLYIDIASDDVRTIISSITTLTDQVPSNGIGFGVLKFIKRDTALDEAGNSSSSIVFNYLGQFDTGVDAGSYFKLADERTGSTLDPRRKRPYLIGVQGGVLGGKLHLAIDYSKAQYSTERITDLARRIEEAIEWIASANPSASK